MDTKKLDRAYDLFKDLQAQEFKLRNHSKIMVALPKHKQKFHNLLYSQVLMKAFNARSAFNAFAKKLKPEERAAFHQAMYV